MNAAVCRIYSLYLIFKANLNLLDIFNGIFLWNLWYVFTSLEFSIYVMTFILFLVLNFWEIANILYHANPDFDSYVRDFQNLLFPCN